MTTKLDRAYAALSPFIKHEPWRLYGGRLISGFCPIDMLECPHEIKGANYIDCHRCWY